MGKKKFKLPTYYSYREVYEPNLLDKTAGKLAFFLLVFHLNIYVVHMYIAATVWYHIDHNNNKIMTIIHNGRAINYKLRLLLPLIRIHL